VGVKVAVGVGVSVPVGVLVGDGVKVPAWATVGVSGVPDDAIVMVGVWVAGPGAKFTVMKPRQ